SLLRPVARDKSGNCKDPTIYRPYSVATPEGEIRLVFRDKVLSDLIGFDYPDWDPLSAAEDFIGRLERIRSMVGEPERHLAS
ncbi:MAG: hypothetical protein GWO24_00225, partial [Akkermansiaceae bacterium]|nr:hypothetical protein [Akkermansiaceae bacterium]NIT76539.1 hypothetical protein [Thermoplasmata archaeon]NIY02910.1 hypothetical protein [Thermoplasmata archaeon]